jgi:hypothetical protein
MSIARTLVAALAVTALAVPAAQARPVDPPRDIHASLAQAAAKKQQQQDLRTPDGIEAARVRGHAAAQLRRDAAKNAPGATAVDSATRPAPTVGTPPTWPVNPQPITPAHTVKVVDDGGVNWAPIALGIFGGLLAVSAVAFLTTRRRRTQRLRMAS